MCDIEYSGYQATGLTMIDKGDKITTLKHDVNASKFFQQDSVKLSLVEDHHTLVGHCRFPTKGDVKFSRNNHPFRFGNTIIVHQGVLNNDEQLKKKYQFKPEGETDSWIIVHLIEKFRQEGKSVENAIAAAHAELKGSWGVVLVDLLQPDKLFIFCHTKSFKVNYYPDDGLFMFSTDNAKLDRHGTDIISHFKFFEELTRRRVAEMNVGSEELLVLGGQEPVELWTLPDPDEWFGKTKYKFGDGWKDKDKHEETGALGRLPLKNKELAIL